MDIEITREAGILAIRLNRPQKKNALTAAMYQQLADAFATAEHDPAVRVVLLSGSDEIFSAGNDLDDFMRAPPATPDAPVFQFLQRLSTAPKPVIAAVAGKAIGIGVTLLLHCDLVYAAANASFALPFARLGLCPEAGSSLLLPRLAGHARAAEMLLLGEPFDADEALRIGLVNRVLAGAELSAFARAQAAKLAALPAASLRATKALMKASDVDDAVVAERMQREAAQFAAMLRSAEAREAFSAFAEKRAPDFSRFD